MKDLKLWRFILDRMEQNKPLVFLCVLESIGSSPGRQGFKMAVSESEICGSIGGGIMEHKFVELAKEKLLQSKDDVLVKQQIHSKQTRGDQSGMICSGEQTIVIYPLKASDKIAISEIIKAIESHHHSTFEFSPAGFNFLGYTSETNENVFIKVSEYEWRYTELLSYNYHVHIIGGGHVSLAFSRLMRELDFYITVYDDRPDLNTMQQNEYAHQKKIIDYETIEKLIPEGKNQYIVIMTFGYRSDGVVIRKLIKKNYRYIGLLGSESKVKKMLGELNEEGVNTSEIKSLHAPVGIRIKSQTPEEIAISIAAEIIKIKNA
jgi:xanthine dehydrogenase accessory factor